jgi:branched-chain amino acid transport system substrate-binding protein
LVFNKRVQFATGGFRSEALLAYQLVFMNNKIPFINTGAATDVFGQNVKNEYAIFKYFFRINPINSTSLGTQILFYLAFQMLLLNATYPNHDVVDVGILAEDLTWTVPNVAAITNSLPAITSLISGGLLVANIAETILYDITLTSADMATHLTTLEAAGCDIVIPLISAQGGILMMNQYATLTPDYLLIGIDVQSQLDTFWADSGGDCIYETILQIGYSTNKTTKSIPFWNAYIAEWGNEPLYIASGSYDAVNTYVWAINQSQSLNADTIVTTMESIDRGNFLEGAGGNIAFWPLTHEIVYGYPYAYALFCQWQTAGTKAVLPTFFGTNPQAYPDTLATGSLVVAPWVNASWY